LKPVIAISTGDPFGIGPEISLKAAVHPDVLTVCRPLLIGDHAHLLREAALASAAAPATWPEVSRSAFDEIGSKQGSEFGIEAWREGPAFHDLGAIEIGETTAHAPARKPGAAGGRAAVKYVKQAVGLVRFGAARAVVTAPISKTSLQLAGIHYPGHTELLADLCGVPQDEVAMLFVTPQFKVALLSVHAALKDAIAALSSEAIVKRLSVLHVEHGRWFGRDPRIAVAALNPHAGEEGLFGEEERTILAPALEAARDAGIDARGPFPADTVFARAARDEFDAVLALHHDQATIAVKTSAFGRAVNMTLGLPLLRTSVDHGTAWDIAGKGQADPSSLVEAILLAARLAPRA
jgi:4-hydroxythreonine-4-phosphate dehydrogenase